MRSSFCVNCRVFSNDGQIFGGAFILGREHTRLSCLRMFFDINIWTSK